MHRQCRFVILTGNAAIEIRVFFLGDLVSGLRPERRTVADALRFRAGLLDQVDRHRHVAGLVLDDPLDAPLRRIALGVVHQMQRDAGAARRRLRQISLGHRVAALAVGRPEPGMGAARTARDDIDLVRDHEGGIEADAELADQLGAFTGLCRLDALHEGAGAGPGNRAERFDEIVAVHADAVVFQSQCVVVGVERQGDARTRIVGQKFRCSDRFVAQLFAGIGGVGYQLPQEDILVGIDGMHHEVQQARDIGLKNMVFDGFFLSIAHAFHASHCIAEFLARSELARNWAKFKTARGARRLQTARAGAGRPETTPCLPCAGCRVPAST